MAVILKPEYKKLISQIAEQEGFQAYAPDLKLSEAQGALSKTILVTLKDGEKKLDLILKGNELQLDIALDVLSVFRGEIYMYENLLVKFVEFRKKNSMRDPNLGIAKYYGHYRDSCFALENLTAQGYKVCYIAQPLDKEHLSLVMRQYGKLHSTSFAMKKKDPDLFNKLVEGLRCSKVTKQDLIKKDFFLNQGMAFASLVNKGDAKSMEIVQKLLKNTSRCNNINTFNQDSHVIVHGDCHCQNMLFKYDEKSNKPTDVKLVDWQISTLASPVYDLSYFFLLSSSREDLLKYRYYLKVYHDELSKDLQEMGCNPNEIFPFSQLELHWKECVLFGLSKCLIVYVFLYFEKQLEIVDVEDPKFYNQLDEFMAKKPTNLQKCKQRMTDLLFFIDSENWM